MNSLDTADEASRNRTLSEEADSFDVGRHSSSLRSNASSLNRTISWSDNPVYSPRTMPARQSSTIANEITPIRSNDPQVTRRNYQSVQPADNTSREPGISAENDNGDTQQGAKPSRNGNEERASSQPQNKPDEDESRRPWHRRLADKYGALELDNMGSVARDHLALERTFLAWLRTSLAFASIGIAVTQLFRLNTSISSKDVSSNDFFSNASPMLPPNLQKSSSLLELLGLTTTAVGNKGDNNRLRNAGKPLGATFIGIAILVLLIGFHRYFESQYWIVRGKFPASRGSVALVTFVAASLIVASLVVILAIAPSAIEI